MLINGYSLQKTLWFSFICVSFFCVQTGSSQHFAEINISAVTRLLPAAPPQRSRIMHETLSHAGTQETHLKLKGDRVMYDKAKINKQMWGCDQMKNLKFQFVVLLFCEQPFGRRSVQKETDRK